MSSNFTGRVSERFDNNFFNVRARENEMSAMDSAPGTMPDLKDLQWAIENFFIKVPAAPLIFLCALTSESVTTLQFKTQERTEKFLDEKARKFWDMDLRDISPVSRALEDGQPVRLQNSMNGMPIDGWHVDGMLVQKIEEATNRFYRL